VAAALETLGCGDLFFEGQYFRGHTASKVAVRTSAKIEWMGIHRVERPNFAAVKTNEIILLHFDGVGIDDWKTKWTRRLDHSGRAARMGPHRVKQLELFRRAYGNTANEMALYSKLYKLSDHQKNVLLQHGLLSMIALDHKSFDRVNA
jgi:hypothetical protein